MADGGEGEEAAMQQPDRDLALAHGGEGEDRLAQCAALMDKKMPAALRPHQRAGIRWICGRLLAATAPGALLADSMGLGKTAQALCSLAFLQEIVQQIHASCT